MFTHAYRFTNARFYHVRRCIYYGACDPVYTLVFSSRVQNLDTSFYLYTADRNDNVRYKGE